MKILMSRAFIFGLFGASCLPPVLSPSLPGDALNVCVFCLSLMISTMMAKIQVWSGDFLSSSSSVRFHQLDLSSFFKWSLQPAARSVGRFEHAG